jgi:hypothetical protein
LRCGRDRFGCDRANPTDDNYHAINDNRDAADNDATGSNDDADDHVSADHHA